MLIVSEGCAADGCAPLPPSLPHSLQCAPLTSAQSWTCFRDASPPCPSPDTYSSAGKLPNQMWLPAGLAAARPASRGAGAGRGLHGGGRGGGQGRRAGRGGCTAPPCRKAAHVIVTCTALYIAPCSSVTVVEKVVGMAASTLEPNLDPPTVAPASAAAATPGTAAAAGGTAAQRRRAAGQQQGAVAQLPRSGAGLAGTPDRTEGSADASSAGAAQQRGTVAAALADSPRFLILDFRSEGAAQNAQPVQQSTALG